MPARSLVPWTTFVVDLAYARTIDDVRAALARLYRRDGYKKLLADAFCHGMDWLEEQPAGTTVSASNWRAYLFDYAAFAWRDHLRQYVRPRIVAAIDGWTTTWSMAEVDPARAWLYARACVL